MNTQPSNTNSNTSKQFNKVYLIFKGLNMIKASDMGSVPLLEDIILTQFRVSLSIDDFYQQYEAGVFTRYLAGRNERLFFYKSQEWIRLKKEVINIYGKRCFCCNSNKNTSVDHIVSRYTDKGKSLDINNLQILCLDCNMKKSSKTIDYRKPQHLELLRIYLDKNNIN